jgi:DnaJ-class molecular chaperone
VSVTTLAQVAWLIENDLLYSLMSIIKLFHVASDLVYHKFMSIDELNQDELNIPHPHGEISVKLPNIVDTSIPLRVRGKGYSNENGDFYVKLYVKHTRVKQN